jgi:hypothetical protein
MGMLSFVFLYPFLFGLITAFIAARKNLRVVWWFCLGMLLGILATIVVLLVPRREKERVSDPFPHR